MRSYLTKHTYYSNDDIAGLVQEITRQVTLDGYKPDYIVGITRGGLVPALMMSYYFDVPLETLRVSLRDNVDTESNLWMPEDAIGYVSDHERGIIHSRWDLNKRKNILIVDDINDTGATLEYIKNDWQQSCSQDDIVWQSVWHHNVKFAVLINNDASKTQVDYAGTHINKLEDPVWVDFPWEQWWKR